MNQLHSLPAGAGPALSLRLLWQLMLASVLSACVAPNVVVVDQKTALERQAAGDYPALQNDLEQAGLSPAPEAFTREELAPGRERQGGGALGELAELYAHGEADAEVIDRLLLQKCIGEATSGLLVARPTDCIGAADAAELVRVIGRENLHRRQIWQQLASERNANLERTRKQWRELHLEQVVCGGLVESRADAWGEKAC
ncbi:MAG TPA: hypothetical protein VJU61_17245 [Polyangiaceae bacterium]|nr:hypothetical protein [Polyangiaceae bacterium]